MARIAGNETIHGTGLTTGDIVEEAVRQAGVSGSGAFPVAEDGYTETYPVHDGTGGDSYGHDVLLRSGKNGGRLHLGSGDDVDGGGAGAITIKSGAGVGDATPGGLIELVVGNSTSGANGNSIHLTAGSSTGGTGGDVALVAGNASGGSAHAGRITLSMGGATSGAAGGQLLLVNLPTSDPHALHAVWSDAGALKISAG